MSGDSSYALARGSRSRRRRIMTHTDSSVDDPVLLSETETEDAPRVRAATSSLSAADGDVASVRLVGSPGQHDLRELVALLRRAPALTWVFTGDDVTHGAQHTRGRRCFAEHFAERTRWELQRGSDVVINTATAGARVADALESVQRQVLRFRPDVVSMMFGLHDAVAGPPGRSTFRNNLVQLIQRLRYEGIRVLLHTPNRILPNSSPVHADLRNYVRIVRETALDFDVPCVDHWEHWKRAGNEVTAEWLSRDGLHPNALGHRELARQLFMALEIFDDTSPTCRA